ncbi:MAG: acyltransferase [Candidatus Eisenbacteria bacterium]
MSPAVTLADRARGRDNNFNLLRLCAAALVLVSHSWPLTATPGEPLEAFAGFSLGHLGVDLFFVVSGFLVTGSLLARPSLRAFGRARALRIFPALAASAFGTALVLGPLVTELPVARYFSDPGTWRYAFQNSVTWPLGVYWWLPGVFAHQPGGPAVNGALWSLPWELTLYVLLALLGATLLRGRTPRAWFGGTVFAIAAAATAGHGLNEAMGLTHRFELVQGLRFVALFFTAGALQCYRHRIRLDGPWFVAALLALPGVLWLRGGAHALYPLLLGYVTLWLAVVPGGVLRRYNRLGDYSYGLYLWQFPLQQCVVLKWPGLTPLELMLMSLPAALLVAVLSWHFVESRALAFKESAPAAAANT